MDAFDADVLIFSVNGRHPCADRLHAHLATSADSSDLTATAGLGSALLVPEVLIKPTRNGDREEAENLKVLLGRLDLRVLDHAIADLSVVLGASYGLKAMDAAHLATVHAEADRFITNNKKDFPKSITEIDITYPEDLPKPPGSKPGG